VRVKRGRSMRLTIQKRAITRLYILPRLALLEKEGRVKYNLSVRYNRVVIKCVCLNEFSLFFGRFRFICIFGTF